MAHANMHYMCSGGSMAVVPHANMHNMCSGGPLFVVANLFILKISIAAFCRNVGKFFSALKLVADNLSQYLNKILSMLP